MGLEENERASDYKADYKAFNRAIIFTDPDHLKYSLTITTN